MNQTQFQPLNKNIITDTDAYKIVHWKAVKPGLTKQYTYGESRIGSHYPFVSWIGLTMIVQDHFLQKVTDEMIEEAEELAYLTFGTKEYFNKKGWQRVRDLGYLPMKIMQAPEGLKLPINNVLFTTESTEDWFAPIVNALEPMTMQSWYPTTVATRLMYIIEKLKPLVELTGIMELLVYMINDFGVRGTTSWMSSYRGGAGVLLHTRGSDNLIASRAVGHYYKMKGRAQSVWATEHQCALSFGPGRGEFDYVHHQLDNSQDDLIVSIVIDTYDAFNFLQNVIGSEEISSRIKIRKGRVVFRPDSGNPIYSIERCLEILTSIFGFSINNKGYKVINDNIGLLQGDGMNENSIIELYEEIIKNRWSTDNLVVGSGGGLLQSDMDRDTQRFAIKPSFGIIDGQEINFQKTVITDPTKASKKGKLILTSAAPGNYMTLSSATETPAMFGSYHNLLTPLYHNGDFTPPTFDQILKNAGY